MTTGDGPRPARDVADDELEELVLEALDAADPEAALRVSCGGDEVLIARGLRLFERLRELESLDAAGLVGEAPAPPASTPWPQIPGVRISGILGSGGQGVVLRGEQTYLGRAVAVKVLNPGSRSEAFLRRFRREARVLAALRHPNFVACHDAGVLPDGTCHLVMELVEGPTLARHLLAGGALREADALALVADLARALAVAHARGIVHRDVKSENVLLEPRAARGADDAFPFTPKLADLGLARTSADEGEDGRLTHAGTVLGTPATMAPEQFDGSDGVDERADVYGLGCVLFHALTGRPAFPQGGIAQALEAKLALREAGGRIDAPSLRAPVRRLVERMLAWEREERPKDAAALLAEIERLGGAARARRTTVAIASGLVVVAVLAAVALSRLAGRDPVPSALVTEPVRTPPPAVVVLGEPMPLFPSDGDVLANDWTSDSRARWAVDESGTGAIANAPRTATVATRSLPAGAFRLAGSIEPRHAWSAARGSSPVHEVAARVECGEEDGLGLEITPEDDGLFTARWRRLARVDGAWIGGESLAEWSAAFGLEDPLGLAVEWDGARLVARGGTRSAPLQTRVVVEPAAAPSRLSLGIDRGVAVFTHWSLASPSEGSR